MNYKLLFISAFMVISGSSAVAESALFGPSKNDLAYQKLIKQNRNEIAALKRQVYNLKERLDGLTTVIEGLNATINSAQNQQSASTAGALSALEAKIDRMDRECVRQKDLNTRNNRSNDKKRSVTHSTRKGTGGDPALSGKSNSVLYSEAVRLFQKDRYTEAKKRFTHTATKSYKPAASNYYLGEIAYYTKKYSDAIFYFKKSAGLYDQASYIDTLLLHTAISLDKTGDRTQAKAFYQTIIDNYPKKKSATIARKKLNQ